jgi:hypothetical protein
MRERARGSRENTRVARRLGRGAIQARVLEGDRAMRRERYEELLVVTGEASFGEPGDDDCADRAVSDLQRRRDGVGARMA